MEQNKYTQEADKRSFCLDNYRKMAERFNKMSFRDKILTIQKNNDIIQLASDHNWWRVKVIDEEIDNEIVGTKDEFHIPQEWDSREIYDLIDLLGITRTDYSNYKNKTMKAKVTIGGKEHEIAFTDEQIKKINNTTWGEEYLKMFPLVGHGSICISSTIRPSMIAFCFPNTEITNEVLSKINLLIDMTQFALLRNNGHIPLTDDERFRDDVRFGIYYCGECYYVLTTEDASNFVFGITVKSEEIAHEMLSIFKEDIKKYY